MKKAFILASIAIRQMLGLPYSVQDIKAEVELTKELMK